MNPNKPLKPNEYEEDGIIYVKDDSSGWKFFDEGGTLDEEDDTPDQGGSEDSTDSDDL